MNKLIGFNKNCIYKIIILIVFIGKNAIITGGSRGIGNAVAKILANCGANVILFGRYQNTLDDSIKELNCI